jgi:hypothetical protein
MHKSLSYVLTIGLLTAIAVTAPIRSTADEKKPSVEAVDKEKKAANIPFHGKLHAVDKSAKTITLEGKEKKRTIHLTAQTRIAKAGKPATLEDAVAGEEVGGQIVKNGDGKEEAVSLRLGAKPEEKTKEKKAPKSEQK